MDYKKAEVVGSGAVYFVDGSSIRYSDVSEQYSNEDAIRNGNTENNRAL